MGTKPETRFKERIRPLLSKLPNTWFVKIQQVALRGTPDFLMCVHGHFVALELKASSKDHASELQKFNLANIVKAKGFGFVVHPENWETVHNYLQILAETGLIPDYDNTQI